MNYIGKKSLSSVFAHILRWLRYAVIALMILGIPLEIIALFSLFTEVHWINELLSFMTVDRPVPEQTPIMRILLTLQIALVAPSILILIRKLERLFGNFAGNTVFRRVNVKLLWDSTMLVSLLSVATLNFISLVICGLLAILCAIFRHGVALQEDSDLTV